MNRIFSLFLTMAVVLVSGGAAFAKDIQVKGYTKKDGTKVAGYTKHVKDKDEKTFTTETAKTETKTSDNKGNDTVEVKGYTKKDGTKVAGYTRKKSSKSK
jgi:hypothetical protein